jgi:hypothetical protein
MRETITLSIARQLLRKIDVLRGDVPRSKFITRLIESTMFDGTSRMVKSPADKSFEALNQQESLGVQ